MMGVSITLILENKTISHTTALIIFGIQYFLNLIWTPVFFGAKSFIWSSFIISALLPFIIWTIFEFYKISPPAAWFLIPYLGWVIFATFLSFSFLKLNPNL